MKQILPKNHTNEDNNYKFRYLLSEERSKQYRTNHFLKESLRDALFFIDSGRSNPYITYEKCLEKEYDSELFSKDRNVERKGFRRETLVIDVKEDTRLRNIVNEIQKEIGELNRLKKKYSYIIDQVNRFFDVSKSHENENIENQSKMYITKLLKEKKRNFFYIGEIQRFGVCRHRCILFKYLCDMSGLYCDLVRGKYKLKNGEFKNHIWVRIRFEKYKVQLSKKKKEDLEKGNLVGKSKSLPPNMRSKNFKSEGISNDNNLFNKIEENGDGSSLKRYEFFNLDFMKSPSRRIVFFPDEIEKYIQLKKEEEGIDNGNLFNSELVSGGYIGGNTGDIRINNQSKETPTNVSLDKIFSKHLGRKKKSGDSKSSSTLGPLTKDGVIPISPNSDEFLKNSLATENGSWTCQKCGYQKNTSFDESCQKCKETKKGWTCTRCDFKNSDDKRICSICLTDRRVVVVNEAKNNNVKLESVIKKRLTNGENKRFSEKEKELSVSFDEMGFLRIMWRRGMRVTLIEMINKCKLIVCSKNEVVFEAIMKISSESDEIWKLRRSIELSLKTKVQFISL